MDHPKPSQNPSLSQSAEEIALTSTKPYQPVAYRLIHDEEPSTEINSVNSSQHIPNQEAPTQLPSNQNIIHDTTQNLTISPGLAELKYHELHLAGHPGWRPPVKGILSLIVLINFVVPLIIIILFGIWYAFKGRLENDFFKSNSITLVELLYMDLVFASLIPIAYFLNYRFHGLRPGWTNSVECRIRWCWLFICLGLSIVSIIAAGIIISMFAPVEKDNTGNTQDAQNTESAQSEPNGSSSSAGMEYAIIFIFLTPLQAAGEEFVFRGYLTQAFSALFSKRWRWMGILIPAILFTMAHGFDQTFPLMFNRFVCGIATGVLVILTGGLEAGIAMHVVNNMLSFTVAWILDKLDQIMKTGSTLGNQQQLIIITTILEWTVYVVLTMLLARNRKNQTKVLKAVVQPSKYQ